MTNREVVEKILAYHPQFPAEYAGCDDWKCGDPDAECTGIVTALAPTVNVIRKAIELGASPEEIIQLITQENESFLTQVPGIGKKTAGRIILELKDPFLKEYGQQEQLEVVSSSKVDDSKKEEVQLALLQLGYSKAEVSSFFKTADWDLSIEELIREALKSLARW